MRRIFYFILTIFCINLIIRGFELIKLIIFLERLNILFIMVRGLDLIVYKPVRWVYFIVAATIGVVFILCLLRRLWFCDNFYL